MNSTPKSGVHLASFFAQQT